MEQTLFLLRTRLLKKQIEFQRIEGPTLYQLSRLSQPTNIFSQVNIDIPHKKTIIVRNDRDSLARCLYLSVLALCCDQHYEKSQELSCRFKDMVYAERYAGMLEAYATDQTTRLLFSSELIIKKIAAQFFMEIMYKKKEQVWDLVNRMPCLDGLMIAVIKKVLSIHDNSSFDSIRDVMSSRLNLLMKRINFSSFSIIDKIMVREDEGWILEINAQNQQTIYDRNNVLSDRLSTFLGPRVVISEESNSIRSEHQLSDIIERIGPQCSSESKSVSKHEASVQEFILKPEETSFLRERINTDIREPFSIFDGMTSDAIVSLLSPRHIRNMNQRKKQSIMTVIGSSKGTAKLKPDRDTQSQNGDTLSSKPSSSEKNSRMRILQPNFNKSINTPYAIKHPSLKATPKPQVITFNYSNGKQREPKLFGTVSRLQIKPTTVLTFQPKKPISHRISRIKSPLFV